MNNMLGCFCVFKEFVDVSSVMRRVSNMLGVCKVVIVCFK